MTAAMSRIERSPLEMTAPASAGEKHQGLRHEIGQVLGVLAVMAATAAAIVGMRLLAYALGHEPLPLFRELSKVWN